MSSSKIINLKKKLRELIEHYNTIRDTVYVNTSSSQVKALREKIQKVQDDLSLLNNYTEEFVSSLQFNVAELKRKKQKLEKQSQENQIKIQNAVNLREGLPPLELSQEDDDVKEVKLEVKVEDDDKVNETDVLATTLFTNAENQLVLQLQNDKLAVTNLMSMYKGEIANILTSVEPIDIMNTSTSLIQQQLKNCNLVHVFNQVAPTVRNQVISKVMLDDIDSSVGISRSSNIAIRMYEAIAKQVQDVQVKQYVALLNQSQEQNLPTDRFTEIAEDVVRTMHGELVAQQIDYQAEQTLLAEKMSSIDPFLSEEIKLLTSQSNFSLIPTTGQSTLLTFNNTSSLTLKQSMELNTYKLASVVQKEMMEKGIKVDFAVTEQDLGFLKSESQILFTLMDENQSELVNFTNQNYHALFEADKANFLQNQNELINQEKQLLTFQEEKEAEIQPEEETFKLLAMDQHKGEISIHQQHSYIFTKDFSDWSKEHKDMLMFVKNISQQTKVTLETIHSDPTLQKKEMIKHTLATLAEGWKTIREYFSRLGPTYFKLFCKARDSYITLFNIINSFDIIVSTATSVQLKQQAGVIKELLERSETVDTVYNEILISTLLKQLETNGKAKMIELGLSLESQRKMEFNDWPSQVELALAKENEQTLFIKELHDAVEIAYAKSETGITTIGNNIYRVLSIIKKYNCVLRFESFFLEKAVEYSNIYTDYVKEVKAETASNFQLAKVWLYFVASDRTHYGLFLQNNPDLKIPTVSEQHKDRLRLYVKQIYAMKEYIPISAKNVEDFVQNSFDSIYATKPYFKAFLSGTYFLGEKTFQFSKIGAKYGWKVGSSAISFLSTMVQYVDEITTEAPPSEKIQIQYSTRTEDTYPVAYTTASVTHPQYPQYQINQPEIQVFEQEERIPVGNVFNTKPYQQLMKQNKTKTRIANATSLEEIKAELENENPNFMEEMSDDCDLNMLESEAQRPFGFTSPLDLRRNVNWKGSSGYTSPAKVPYVFTPRVAQVKPVNYTKASASADILAYQSMCENNARTPIVRKLEDQQHTINQTINETDRTFKFKDQYEKLARKSNLNLQDKDVLRKLRVLWADELFRQDNYSRNPYQLHN
jgi:hypothetical protein